MKKIFTLLIAMLLTRMTFAQVSTWNGSWEPWTHGTGTEADPFLIENAQQLAYLAYRVNNGLDAGGGHVSNHDYHYKLMVDVDLNGSEDFQWTPIGYYIPYTDEQHFGGYFDGNGHTISKLYINSSDCFVGFFGSTEGATIQNLSVRGLLIATNNSYGIAGGIVGDAYISKILNCNNTCNISFTSRGGGIAGYTCGTTITNCYNTGNVSGSSSGSDSYCFSGGIVGASLCIGCTTAISNCYNLGCVSSSVSASYSYSYGCSSGGILGLIDSETTLINNCFNEGNVFSSSSTNSSCSGGIVGKSNHQGTHSVTNCYNTGIVSANNSGGIIGYDQNECNVTNCYYLNTCGGNYTNGGVPMSDAAMKSVEFVDMLNNGTCSWIFDNANMNNGYPVLTMVSYSAGTLNATGITATSAILNGFVTYDNTSAISKGFEYRKAGELNYTSINITNNSDYFSYNLTGLTTNTTYEYRTFLNVADCDVTSYGDTKTFTLSLLNNDTICIYDADMLRWVSEQCNSGTTFEGYCIKLMNDITLPLNVPNNMTSIGAYPNYPFKGTFDGNGKLITNLYIDQPNTPYQGFFGYTLNANLYNVGLVNITASGRNYTGGMVAYAKNTYMRDCYVNGGTLFALSYCGGLVGYQEQGTNSIISGCYNTCEVTGNNYVGGLIGFSNYSTVRNSYVAGRVSAQGNAVGAIIGGANEVLMYYCYFSTEITGQTNAIGENNNGNGKDGGEGLTNAQMRDPQFVNTLNQNLVTPVWMADYATHINNGFPIIKWQRPGTGVEENVTIKNYISLYPNPANNFVTIQSDAPNVSLKYVEVYDVMGRKVMSEELDGQSQELSVAKLLSGVYHVRVQASNGCYTNLKLVVQ